MNESSPDRPPSAPPRVGSVRALAREQVRARLAIAARDLFAEHGFDNVTVDEITTAAGVSRRTYFRHFPSKEDAVFGQMEMLGQGIAGALESCPPDVSAWEALRIALHTMFQRIAEEPAGSLRLYKMLRTTPSLRAARTAKQFDRMNLLTPLVRARLLVKASIDTDKADIAASALTGAALACVDTALEIWAASDGEGDPAEALDSAMALVGHLTPS